jgi:hypothetical protein
VARVQRRVSAQTVPAAILFPAPIFAVGREYPAGFACPQGAGAAKRAVIGNAPCRLFAIRRANRTRRGHVELH